MNIYLKIDNMEYFKIEIFKIHIIMSYNDVFWNFYLGYKSQEFNIFLYIEFLLNFFFIVKSLLKSLAYFVKTQQQ